MKLSSAGFNQHSPPAGDKNCLNSELWHACAGPLVSLPTVGSHVVYFPQGHSEQVAASTNKEVDAQTPNYPSLNPQLICQLHNVTMHADIKTDEVYAQMTLQPLSPQEQKEVSFLPTDLGPSNKQPLNYFCKTLTASDTSTHGGFSVPRRSAEKVFPPLDFSMQPPAQELIAKDLHNNEWKFRHIFRGELLIVERNGQPKRHLLTTGWSIFVNAKRLVAGDSVLFIWNEKNQLLLGIRRANRPQTVMPSSVLSSDSMHLGLVAAAAHAASTNSRFTIFYNPRASPTDFVIPLAKYWKAVYHTRVCIGLRFRMLFETEESSVRRYMGTITTISDLDPVKWPNSQWRSIKVGWDESAAGERQQRVSLWEIEPLNAFPMYSSPFPLRLKQSWPLGLPTLHGMKGDDMGGFNSSLMWFGGDVGDRGMQFLHQGMTIAPWMQPRIDSPMLAMQNDVYQAMAAASAVQEMTTVDPSKHHIISPMMQFQQPQLVGNRSIGSIQPQMLQHSQSLAPFPQTIPGEHFEPSHSSFQPQQFHQNSFSSLPIQQQQQSVPMQQVMSHGHVQLQSQSMFSVPQNFTESNITPVAGNTSSPLHSLLDSITSQGEASNLLNVPQAGDFLSSGVWPAKRVAFNPLIIPSSIPQGVVSPLIDQLSLSSTNATHNPVSLSPFSSRECLIEQEGSNDPQNHFLFGVNIDSSDLLMPNAVLNLKGVGADIDNATGAFAFDADSSLNQTISSCIDDSGFLPSSNTVDHTNSPYRTFVKVYKSGSFGRSLDITKFSSYNELRQELALMFGLEGQLEDHLRSGWQLVFVDRENDVLLLGDDPWQEFVNSVWCIKILSPQEVQKMGKQGFELLSSVPCQKFASQLDARNMNTGIPSVGILDF